MKNICLLLLSLIALSSAFRARNVETGTCVQDTNELVEGKFYTVQSNCSAGGTNFELDVGSSPDLFKFRSKLLLLLGKCLYLNNDNYPNSDSLYVRGYNCKTRGMNPYYQWNLINVQDNQYLVQHAKSGMCLLGGQEFLVAAKNCDYSNTLMLWTQFFP